MKPPEANEGQHGTKAEFQTKIGLLSRSQAYLEFCQKVYGYRLMLLNMMDREQIDTLTEVANVSVSV